MRLDQFVHVELESWLTARANVSVFCPSTSGTCSSCRLKNMYIYGRQGTCLPWFLLSSHQDLFASNMRYLKASSVLYALSCCIKLAMAVASTDSYRDADFGQTGYLPNHNMV
jgi:hypothetical protein